MIILVLALLVLPSIVWLVVGIQGRKETAILKLNLCWWLGSFVSAYAVWLAWQDRAFSENWAMMGFMFFSLPYCAVVGTMAIAELVSIRKWESDKTRTIRLTSAGLLLFCVLQVLLGLLSTQP
jgi:hypothetical protein